MERILTDTLAGQLDRSSLTIHYRIGDAFSGWTDFQLHGDGGYRLESTVTHGRQRRSYDGRVELEVVDRLLRDLQAARVWEAAHVFERPGEDDPEASIEVTAGDRSSAVTLWVSEIRRVPGFAEAQRAILRLVRQLSNGEVLETGS